VLKIFTTQLIGRLKKIEDSAEFSLEDAARLLAQALVGEGHIYLYGDKEMKGVYHEASQGQEPLAKLKELTPESVHELHPADRVIVFTRYANDEEALKIGHALAEKDIPFVAVSSHALQPNPAADKDLSTIADVFIPLHVEKGLVPTETGGRTGYPHLICALYVYHNIKLLIDEILEESK